MTETQRIRYIKIIYSILKEKGFKNFLLSFQNHELEPRVIHYYIYPYVGGAEIFIYKKENLEVNALREIAVYIYKFVSDKLATKWKHKDKDTQYIEIGEL